MKAAAAKERRKSINSKKRMRKRSFNGPYKDDSEVLRRRMSRFGGGGVFPGSSFEGMCLDIGN